MLEKWQNESVNSLLLGNEAPKLIAAANDQSQVLDLDAPLAEVAVRTKPNKYTDLIK